MIDKSQRTRMARVMLVNQMPLNRVAMRFLKGMPLPTEPAVLTLIRWGLENGLTPEPLAPGEPDADSMMATLNAMASRWDPREAVRFLTNPESAEDVVLTADELEAAEDAEEAAALLIENLYNAMVANAP